MKTFLANFIFSLLFINACWSEYHSQAGQDKYVNENFFKGKKGGVFVDIGAYDGIKVSNTLFFEKELDWKGICIEPLPEPFELLKENRNCITLNCALGKKKGIINFIHMNCPSYPDVAMLSCAADLFTEDKLNQFKEVFDAYPTNYQTISVKAKTLNSILKKYKIFKIDFLSIDIEGGELEALKNFDFNRYKIHIMTIENNQREANQTIRRFLEKRGFRFVTRLEQDEIYENKSW